MDVSILTMVNGQLRAQASTDNVVLQAVDPDGLDLNGYRIISSNGNIEFRTAGNVRGGYTSNSSNATLGYIGCGDTNNTFNGLGGFIGAGVNNRVSGNHSSVGGGNNNDALSNNSVIVGGQDNTANALGATIICGIGCTASSNHILVSGNTANSACLNTVAIGDRASTTNSPGTAFGGTSANVTSSNGVVIGGDRGLAKAPYATSIGGLLSTSNGQYGTTLAGRIAVGYASNHQAASVIAGNSNNAAAAYTTIMSGETQQLQGAHSTIWAGNDVRGSSSNTTMFGRGTTDQDSGDMAFNAGTGSRVVAYGDVQLVFKVDSQQTLTNAPATSTVSIPPNGIVVGEVYVVGLKTDGTKGGSYRVYLNARRAGTGNAVKPTNGAITMQNVTVLTEDTATWTCTCQVSGSTINITAAGPSTAGGVFNWCFYWQYARLDG